MIAIVDYQMGNLRSVQKGFEKVGAHATVTSDPAVISQAEKVVLPGVGAFGDAMFELKKRGLVEPVVESIKENKPFLGICLGLQMLFDVSYEGGKHEGMGILPGEVVRFEVPREFKVPHMGWNQAEIKQDCPLLTGIENGTYFYFVHSYFVSPSQNDCIAIESTYDKPFCAMVWRENLYATQFHPEKSQSNGLKILKNFANLT